MKEHAESLSSHVAELEDINGCLQIDLREVRQSDCVFLSVSGSGGGHGGENLMT